MHSYSLEGGQPAYSQELPGEQVNRGTEKLRTSGLLLLLILISLLICLGAGLYLFARKGGHPAETSAQQPPADLKRMANKANEASIEEAEESLAVDSLQPDLSKLPYCLVPSQTMLQVNLQRDVNLMRDSIVVGGLSAGQAAEFAGHLDTNDLQGPFSIDGQLGCKFNGVSVLKGSQTLVEMTNAKLIWQLAILFKYVGFKQVEVAADLSFKQLLELMDSSIGRQRGFFKEVGVSMSQMDGQGRWFPLDGGQLVNVEFWRLENLELKFLVKAFHERPSSGRRFSKEFAVKQGHPIRYNVLMFPEQSVHSGRHAHFEARRSFNLSQARQATNLSREAANRLQAVDFRNLLAGRGQLDEERGAQGCALCSLAAFKGLTVGQLVEELNQYERAPPAEQLIDLFHRQGVPNLQMSEAMNREEYLDFIEGQVSAGEVIHLDLVYWPADFNQLARVHVKAWRADRDEQQPVRVLVNRFDEPPDSPTRFHANWLSSQNHTNLRWFHDFKISY